MITAYALLLDRCGLSHREAADLHSVRLDTVKSWASGRNRAPQGAIDELRLLYKNLINAAAAQVKFINDRLLVREPDRIEIGLAATDVEAQELGLPCVGAHAALLGMIVAALPVHVMIVERGSTPATAGAGAGAAVDSKVYFSGSLLAELAKAAG